MSSSEWASTTINRGFDDYVLDITCRPINYETSVIFKEMNKSSICSGQSSDTFLKGNSHHSSIDHQMSLLRNKLEDKLHGHNLKAVRNVHLLKSDLQGDPSQMSSKEHVMVATLRMEKSN